MIIFNKAKMQADEKGLQEYMHDRLLWDLLDGADVYVQTCEEDDSVVQRLTVLVRTPEGHLLKHEVDMEWCDQIPQSQYKPEDDDIVAILYKMEGGAGACLYKCAEVQGWIDTKEAKGRRFWRALRKSLKTIGVQA